MLLGSIVAHVGTKTLKFQQLENHVFLNREKTESLNERRVCVWLCTHVCESGCAIVCVCVVSVRAVERGRYECELIWRYLCVYVCLNSGERGRFDKRCEVKERERE